MSPHSGSGWLVRIFDISVTFSWLPHAASVALYQIRSLFLPKYFHRISTIQHGITHSNNENQSQLQPSAVLQWLNDITWHLIHTHLTERGQRNSVQVGNLGKIKTTTQMIATAILLEACPGPSSFDVAAFLRMPRPAFFTTGVALLYIATVLTVISGFQYLQAAWPVLIGNPAQEVPKEDTPKEDSLPKNVRVPFIG